MKKSSTYFPSIQRVCGWWKQTRNNTEWTLELLSETFYLKDKNSRSRRWPCVKRTP